MATVSVSVTEFSRGLSEFLSHVQYQGQTLEIARGKRVIARISPASATNGFPIAKLDALITQGARLGADGAAMAKDMTAARAKLRGRPSAWAK